jgi:uncharacterized membrane protein YeaQ/YmgE (transglycosylase-associated protein family)
MDIGQFLQDYHWLTWIILGGIAGIIAKAIMPGRDPGGCIITILLGIAGAVVAGFLGLYFNLYDPQRGGLIASLIAAVIGALILLAIYRLVAGRRRP